MGLLLGVALVFGAVELINFFLVNFFLVKFCRNWVSGEFVRLGFCSEVMLVSLVFYNKRILYLFICVGVDMT